RKSFEAPASWEGKSVSIELEGAFIETEIYINGTYVGKHVGGYTGFCFDITPYIQTGTNTVAIRVNNLWKANVAPRAGDHQFSGGIYRDVYLNVTNKLHVDWFGTFLTTPEVSTSSAKIKAVTSVKNDYQAQKTFSITTEIYAPNDQLVSSVTSNNISVAAGKTIDITQLLPTITFPQLWSPTTPNLYKAVTKLITDGNQTDSYQTTFGIRFTQWTSSGGFYLNGTKLYLIGANVHQDRAGWGDAATNAAFFRDVKLMKDAGFNSIRGCHYPHDPGFVSACDNLGIIFFSENAFWGMGGSTGDAGNWGIPSSGSYPTNAADQKDFNLSVLQQLKEMIRIHRNSPSIMAWSMSNEPFFSDDITMPKVRALLNETTDSTTLWDPSRFVAIGGCQRQGLDKLGKGQVAFYNGDGAGFPNPGVPNMVSEYSSRSAQRPGDFGPAWGELGSNNNIDSPAPSWRGGQAIWCGIDHGTVGGEGLATMGLVDYFRLPKRQYYWYQECYAKGNRNPIPPTWPTNGTPAKLKIESNKSEISVPDGTDDVMLTVTVQNSIGKTINNNVPVTLKLISGPGEFPTGRSITFLPPDNNNEQTDISIREGMCAIDFRSYYGGISVIEASSPGLQSAKIEIITHGTPRWEEGVTPPVADRPYKRYKEKEPPKPVKDLLLAKDRPCSASTTETTSNKSYANDSDETTSWTPKPTDRDKWWKLDMEATYSLNRIQIVFPTKGIYKYKIEVSPDDKNWQKVIDQSDNATAVKSHMNYGNLGRNVRFVRVKFNSMAGIAEIRVGGSSDLPEKPDLLTGTIIGIEGSWENVEKATKEAAFDFDQTTFFDAPEGASGFWVGIDLGKGAEFKPTQATYFPRTELGVRMKNGTFETGESIEFTEAKTLYTISANAPERYTTINFNAPSYTRYIRYRSTPEGNGN
ncbi:MAG: glycoside hydrolase family 2 TIM barrel-domain containing protein, partial [Bacteroidales bacterium]